MPEFTPHSKVRAVLQAHPEASAVLSSHGYEVGAFTDVLSQYQSLQAAAWAGRLRELPQLLEQLNLLSR
ncbi:MAG TPA: hypothetical protein VNI34_10620 [Candidatus Nitrosotalea sp.]|nr:hypothetical protein [Candidatus Nitrosotalea sp.]